MAGRTEGGGRARATYSTRRPWRTADACWGLRRAIPTALLEDLIQPPSENNLVEL